MARGNPVGMIRALTLDHGRSTIAGRPSERLVGKGAEVIEEPQERFYGIDCAIRDDSGNHIRIAQRVGTGIAPPAESRVNA